MFWRANIKLIIYEIKEILVISHANPHVPGRCIIPDYTVRPKPVSGKKGEERGTLQTRQPSRCRFTYVHPWGFCVCCIPYLTRRRPEYANRTGGWICGEVFVKSTIIDSIRLAAEIASGNQRPTFPPPSPPPGDISEKYFTSLSSFSCAPSLYLEHAKKRRANFWNNRIQLI